jgi:hypothetical protein
MDLEESVCRIEARSDSNHSWWVFGLNLLRYARDHARMDRLMPFRVMLSELLDDEGSTHVLVGGAALEDEAWPATVGFERVETDCTIYGGDLYSSRESGDKPGVMFRDVSKASVTSVFIDHCLPSYNALVVISDVHDRKAIERALGSFTSESDTLSALMRAGKWVIVSGHDAQYLEVWSDRPDAMAAITRSCETVDSAVKRLPWFVEAVPALEWDERTLCYRDRSTRPGGTW